jgi:CYTH domain-containing protein
MIERERTFLPKFLPDVRMCRSQEIIDIYLPTAAHHPTLRIRKKGDRYEITKKEPIATDPSEMKEETIPLTKEEFEELSHFLKGKRTHKVRYYYPYNGKVAEIDVFQGKLAGLVLVDFEFDSVEEKNAFPMPAFCLADVTDEECIAGGMLCGKSYEDIAESLARFGYTKIMQNIS